MTAARLDVVGIGNAIVDLIAGSTDTFLEAEGMAKGSMALIDEARATALHVAMGPALEEAGGSAGNTVAGIASLGGTAGYIGKVRDDELGAVYGHSIRSLGVDFPTAPATEGAATARCLIFVTDDAQRTMNTFLGACVNLTPDDIDEALIADAQITYLEGYLFDPPHAKAAFRKAAAAAHAAGRKVALSLSDSFCVGRYRDEFRDLIAEHIDIVFANSDEIMALYETSDLAAAADAIAGHVALAAITCGAEGSLVVSGTDRIASPAAPVAQVVDTTGAGDLYAAGFLYGLARDLPLAECARIGGIAAAEIISHYGARPETPLASLI